MKKVLWIVRKNFKLVTSDWKGLFFAFLLPFALASITGLAFSGTAGRGASKFPVAVLALDDHPAVEKLIASLEESDSLEIERVDDEEAVRTRIRKRKLLAAVIIPPGTGETLAQGLFSPEKAELRLLIDPSRQVERGVLQGILMEKTLRVLSADMMNPVKARDRMREGLAAIEAGGEGGNDEERDRWAEFMRTGIEMFERLEEAQEAEEASDGEGGAFQPAFSRPFSLEVEPVTGGEKGAQANVFAQTFSGTSVMFLLFGVMSAAANLVQERQKGTLRRILTAPVSRVQILSGEALFYFLFSLSQLTVLFAAGALMFGIPFHGSKPGLLLIAGSTAAAVTGFGILIAAVGRTQKQIEGISILVILTMSAIGGSMFPVWLMPEFMQTLAGATINKWAVLGFEGATWRGMSFAEILWPHATVLLAMATGLFALAVWRFRWE